MEAANIIEMPKPEPKKRRKKPHREKNLEVRNGIYYWRETIAGKYYHESLNTKNKEEAIKIRDSKRAAVKDQDFQRYEKSRSKRMYSSVNEFITAYRAAADSNRAFNDGKPSATTVKGNIACFLRVVKCATGTDRPETCSMGVLTADTVEAWEDYCMKDVEEEDIDRKAISCRSSLNQARCLTAHWALQYYQKAGITYPDLSGWLKGGRVVGTIKPYETRPTWLIDATMEAAEKLRVEAEAGDLEALKFRMCFLLCYNFGLRQSEARNIRRSWFETMTGEAGDEHYLVVKKRPDEGFKPKGINHKKRIRKEVMDELLSYADPDDDYILPGGTPTARENLLNREFSQWMRDIGWDSKTYPKAAHELRKLIGSVWYTAPRLGAEVAKEWLGHSKIETTIRFYANLKRHPLPPE